MSDPILLVKFSDSHKEWHFIKLTFVNLFVNVAAAL